MQQPTSGVSIFTNPASRSPEQDAAYAAAVRDLLGSSDPLAVLADTARAVERILAPLTDAQVRRPEAPGKGSQLQVVHHLADAELMWGYRHTAIAAGRGRTGRVPRR
jgi:hypothetical protein